MTKADSTVTDSAPGAYTERGPVVLIVVEPGLDGVFRHVEGMIGFLLLQRIQVHLAYSSRRCGDGMRTLVERVRATGGEVVDLRVTNYPEPRDLWALFKVMGMIRRIRPDIVHSHSSKAGAIGRIAALLMRHPRSIYSPQAYYGMAKPFSIKVWFYNWVERILGRYGKTVAISGDEAVFAESVLYVPVKRITIIHNPVDSNFFVPPTADQRRAARTALGVPENAVILAMIGRMCWQKDPETAYAGVSPVCKANPDLLFVHLGWGKWKDYLLEIGGKLGISQQLRIVDYTNDPRAFYHAIDGLIVSSRYEAGWPLVFLEAMAENLPVVAATGIGMSDVGRANLSHVWTFPPEEVPACTEAIKSWLASYRQASTECNHRQFAIEHLSPQRCFGAVLELYRGHFSRGSVSPFN